MTLPTGVAPPAADEVVAVVGPTASGKSKLAMALAEAFDGEIIGGDSVQIYRYFDIGSGKPSAADRARVVHHLVDEIDPLEHFDAALYVARADRAIAQVRAHGRCPIVCGGSYLWVKALLHGLAPTPPADPALRARHQALAEMRGRAHLHAMLQEVDPSCAARLAPNDLMRVSRALEVLELTGKTQSAWHAEHRFETVRYRARLIGVRRPREEIDARIARRAARWLSTGWLDEVRALMACGYRNARAMGSVGYRQVRQHLDGEIEAQALQETIVRATRTFVRRQRTWLRDAPMQWIESTS